ncbi:hypothetical protein AGABI1DRAFT_129781 [Agaricus bisporus var. burnettii JB137-S8]|uniref:Uncharacterized protein n=1 Tax=Agaricus bisporus var. burnettii (strain JB137-S8 / ATCC MYA-4627 / FGSC 10392) TaxID=597362 RepID=K5VU54_AGABU|nr:uncharacterized protein AGABI1DRAFT_129781 [Agaricus bisporus var. burnettii JB137-S8]EKM77999.1 hypothetical protein AGABI1DRAFT_129781 [Agaricus bisporus var. burnettii JB137-S8]
MATVFGVPMPALDDAQNMQARPQRRRADPVEIIDVDELDDDVYQTHRLQAPGPSRPTQRNRHSSSSEVISLVDSDEEDLVVGSNNVRPASRTRLQSPPPRNSHWLPVPPVPPVPHRFAGQTSFPMRRQAPAHPSPPIVRPIDNPFPFEASIHQRHPPHGSRPGPSNHPSRLHIPAQNDHSILPPRPLQAAPPSHHVPTMGLGGAIITQNAPRHHHRQHHHRGFPASEADNSLFGPVRSGIRRVIGGPASAAGAGPRNRINYVSFGNNFDILNDATMDEDEDPDHIFHLLAGEEEGLRGWDPGFNPARAFIRSEVIRRRTNTREESPYRKQYTHPQFSEPGFTFDFAPKSPLEIIDVRSPVVEPKSTASHEPIVIDDEEDEITAASSSGSLSFPESHPGPQTPKKSPATPTLVCARCLGSLILGNNLTSEEQKLRRVWGLRCGHLIDGRCLLEIGRPPQLQNSDTIPNPEPLLPATVDRKGKGKAKVAVNEEEHHDNPQDDGDTSIRSRLRSRHVNPTAASSSNPTTKRTTRTKQTQSQMPPPEYTWYCPVHGCGREHASVKVNGEWIPEREDGAYGHSAGSGSGGGRRGRRGAGASTSSTAGRRVRLRFGFGHPEHDWSGSSTSAGPSEAALHEGPRGAIPLFL